MMKSSVVAMLVLSVAACAGAPKTPSERISLEERARVTLSEMQRRDPSLRGILMDAQAYVVFPEIGKGGAIVGGAYGRGVMYERGQPTGSVSLAQASIGAQLGGQTFAELIVIRDFNTVRKIKAGKFDVGADASIVALTAGAAGSTSLDADTTVFVMPRGGLMVDLSVAGQRLDFQPYTVGDISG
jgi:lipid-binding SYLF domain-containing protein